MSSCSENLNPIVWGIDFGASLAGTTVVAECSNRDIAFYASKKHKKADDFLLSLLKERKPWLISIDAPLSLPGYYQQLPDFRDYHYREGDRELGAMSPLFLGGLTARAIQFKDRAEEFGSLVFETYPRALANLYQLNFYKKDLSCFFQLPQSYQQQLDYSQLINQHYFDAFLALLSSLRWLKGQHQSFGHHQEGFITV